MLQYKVHNINTHSKHYVQRLYMIQHIDTCNVCRLRNIAYVIIISSLISKIIFIYIYNSL